MLFSAFTIASAIINNVSLTGSLEKALLVVFAAATALVAVLLDYWIDRKAISTRDKRSSLASAARLLFLGASFGAAVCLAVIVALAVGPIEHIYLSALVGAPLCAAGFFGCLFGKLFQVRIAKQAYVTADDKTPKNTEIELLILEAECLGRSRSAN
jgi:archaellum biogenesis protein FlaJ (TadC family)